MKTNLKQLYLLIINRNTQSIFPSHPAQINTPGHSKRRHQLESGQVEPIRHQGCPQLETSNIMKRYIRIFLYTLISLPVAANSAEQVYTWVDDSGTTHFSEAPPPEPAIEAQLVEVLPTSGAAPGNMADDDFYSSINQAERMQTRRLENEKLIAEKKLAEAKAGKARAEAQAALQNSYNDAPVSYYPVYPYYPRYRRHRPWRGHGQRPGHGYRPGYSRPGRPRASLGKTPGMPHF